LVAVFGVELAAEAPVDAPTERRTVLTQQIMAIHADLALIRKR
jgi:hypothetical protein